MSVVSTLRREIGANWKTLALHGLIFALLFQVLMLIALMVRFQTLPNYITFYNWIGNVLWVIQSTPSFSDMWPIIREEWLIEIGWMNYEYGNGLSVWSLNVIPSRLIVLFILGAMLSLCLILMRSDECSLATGRTFRATTGLGAVLVAMTNVTLSWVVCCAAPTWVVGLAMLGLGVSTSLALETMGPTLSISGFSLLVAMILVLAWRKSRPMKQMNGVSAHA